MSYAETIEKLFTSKGMKLGLQNITDILAKLGNPERKFRTIHVAGTNGKGSVSTKIAYALQLAGYKTGLFTSPHISTFRERIQINGRYISEEQVVKLFPDENHLTFFEKTTALAFRHFAQEQVDYAVIETGLGGRLDATNCILPELAIITSIAFDHTEILGNTLEAIAREKAGIIKEKIPIIIGPRVNKEHIAPLALQKQAPLIQVTGEFETFDAENSALAKRALELLKIPDKIIAEGCKVRPPCRMETVTSPHYPYPLILDVGHNPDGLKALFNSLKWDKPNILVGLSRSKDIQECLKVLMHYGSHLYLVKADHPRGAETKVLKDQLEALGFSHYTCCSSIAQALKLSMGPLVICGSFFIMDEARRALGLSYPRDPVNLNERY